MRILILGLSAMLIVIALASCKGSGGDSGSSATPSNPTAPSASALCSPPVVTTCTDPAAPNDGRTSIGQVTVTAGGAPSCRVAIGEAIPISFTIVRPNSAVTWSIETSPPRTVATPASGSAGSAGPFQATAQFVSFGGDNRTDEIIRITTNHGLACEVPIHGRR